MKKEIGHDIENRIVEIIQSGTAGPGDRLPSERSLAAQFEVSRNTVREAIRALSEKGILTSKRGSGSYVAARACDKIAQGLRKAADKKAAQIMEVFEIRKILESAAAAKAARIAPPEAFTQLSRILENQEQAFASGENTSKWDMAFHEALISLAQNSVLSSAYAVVLQIMKDSGIPDIQFPERSESSLLRHRTILRSLMQRDEASAHESVARHMDEIETLLKEEIKKSLK